MAVPATANASDNKLQHVSGLPPPDKSLPVLAHIKNRETYRERPEGETEEAHWYSAEEPNTLVEAEQVRLRSIHSKQASVVVFTNKSLYRVRALWVDFKGNEVVYSVLEPNSTKRYHTYVTHPWIVREVNSGTRMMLSGRPTVIGMSTQQTVEVQAPPELTWTMDTHSCFPAAFQSSVRGLLLAHKKLEAFAAATQGPASPSVLAARSIFDIPNKKSALSLSQRQADGDCCPAERACPTFPRASLRARCDNAPISPKASRPLALVLPAPCPSGGSVANISIPLSPCGRVPAASAVDMQTTSISITSEAAHFTATLTVSSPKRSIVRQNLNLNIELQTGNGSTSVNFGTVLGGAATASASANSSGMLVNRAPLLLGGPMGAGCFSQAASSRRCSSTPAQAGKNGRSSFLSIFKNMLHKSTRCTGLTADAPAGPVGTLQTFKFEVHRQDCDAAAPACNIMVDDNAPWPPVDTHLGNLPSHLLVLIAELAAPQCYQTLAQPPKGRPDIMPTLMACPPQDPEEDTQENDAAQQQDQGQQQQAL